MGWREQRLSSRSLPPFSSQFIVFAVYALAFWYGGTLLAAGKLTFDDMLRAFFAIVLAAFGAAQAQVAFPALSSGPASARRGFGVIDRVPGPTGTGAAGGEGLSGAAALAAAVSPRKGGGKKGGKGAGPCPPATASTAVDRWAGPGAVSFTDVHFAYPARPDTPVLSGFSLTIPAGSFTALVGPSGGGKSTVFALLERFYDAASGTVCLDGADVRGLRLTHLRSALALVGQEPALFTGTIRENVAYGRRGASDAEVRAALDAAQASEFVFAKPEGWLTKVKRNEGEG